MTVCPNTIGHEFSPEQGLLIVSDLDDKGDIKDFLQPLCENERYEMSQMQRFRGWSLKHINMHTASKIHGLLSQMPSITQRCRWWGMQ